MTCGTSRSLSDKLASGAGVTFFGRIFSSIGGGGPSTLGGLTGCIGSVWAVFWGGTLTGLGAGVCGAFASIGGAETICGSLSKFKKFLMLSHTPGSPSSVTSDFSGANLTSAISSAGSAGIACRAGDGVDTVFGPGVTAGVGGSDQIVYNPNRVNTMNGRGTSSCIAGNTATVGSVQVGQAASAGTWINPQGFFSAKGDVIDNASKEWCLELSTTYYFHLDELSSSAQNGMTLTWFEVPIAS